jgi:hypothetical protein
MTNWAVWTKSRIFDEEVVLLLQRTCKQWEKPFQGEWCNKSDGQLLAKANASPHGMKIGKLGGASKTWVNSVAVGAGGQ